MDSEPSSRHSPAVRTRGRNFCIYGSGCCSVAPFEARKRDRRAHPGGPGGGLIGVRRGASSCFPGFGRVSARQVLLQFLRGCLAYRSLPRDVRAAPHAFVRELLPAHDGVPLSARLPARGLLPRARSTPADVRQPPRLGNVGTHLHTRYRASSNASALSKVTRVCSPEVTHQSGAETCRWRGAKAAANGARERPPGTTSAGYNDLRAFGADEIAVLIFLPVGKARSLCGSFYPSTSGSLFVGAVEQCVRSGILMSVPSSNAHTPEADSGVLRSGKHQRPHRAHRDQACALPAGFICKQKGK